MASLSKSKRIKVYNKRNGRCIYCDCALLHPDEDDNSFGSVFHVDHINPKSRGGSYSKIENLTPSCLKCNYSKGTHTPFKWKEIIDKKIIEMQNEISWMKRVSKNINLRFVKKNG